MRYRPSPAVKLVEKVKILYVRQDLIREQSALWPSLYMSPKN